MIKKGRAGKLSYATAFAIATGNLPGITQPTNGFMATLARTFSSEMRNAETRLPQIEEDLAGLPVLTAEPMASRYGFRSQTLFEQDSPQWIQIDLGRVQLVDRIIAVPTHIPRIGERGKGYGFPLRFKIELGNDPEMSGAKIAVDHTQQDVPPPGRYPLIFRTEATSARYVRFTSTRNFPVEEGFLWALEEILVLSGNNSVAVGKQATASSSLDVFPNWSVERINDGMSALGIPVNNEESLTRGYLSGASVSPFAEKWLEIDLGRDYEIDEVCLLPLEPRNFEVLGLQSFPRAWTAELATDSSFTQRTWHLTRPRTNLPGYPGSCGVELNTGGRRGRYFRISTQDLWGPSEQHSFGLSEIQIYSNGQNIALGKDVGVRDQTSRSDNGWKPEFVVDGYSSRNRIIEYPEFLDLIKTRQVLEKEREQLRETLLKKIRATTEILSYGGSSLGAMTVLGWAIMWRRQRKHQKQAVTALRNQIARDLHDDIGSNLGGIVLLSEMGSRQCTDPRFQGDFRDIKKAAEETAQSMQDLVWLIERGKTSLRDLLARMRHSTETILGDTAVTWNVEPANFRDRNLSLFFRRHFFFAFKEALNNVRRHAKANKVDIIVRIETRILIFNVNDDGIGLDLPHLQNPGHGLANLKRRAKKLGGLARIESKPNQGTSVTFKASLDSKVK